VGASQHDVLRVSTSDNVGIGYDIAGLGSRFIAQLLDSLLVGIIALVIDIPVAAAVSGSDTQQTLPLAALAVSGVTLVVYIGYFTICEVSTGGRTPGKSSGRLRVLDISGAAPTAAAWAPSSNAWPSTASATCSATTIRRRPRPR